MNMYLPMFFIPVKCNFPVGPAVGQRQDSLRILRSWATASSDETLDSSEIANRVQSFIPWNRLPILSCKIKGQLRRGGRISIGHGPPPTRWICAGLGSAVNVPGAA